MLKKLKEMELHNLKPAEGSVKTGKRVGRGEGSGRGGTSTRGNKGAQSRSGYSRKPGFEGGQMPIQRRLPKRGFKNINRVEYKVFNLGDIQRYIDKYSLKAFDIEGLKENRLIQKNDLVKVLGRGELKAKVNINVHAISESAKKAVEDAGGSVNLINK